MQEDDELLFPECSDEDDHTIEEREFVEDAESNANFLSQDKENNADFIYEVVSESRTSEDLYHSEDAEATESSENSQGLSMSELSSALEKVEGQPVLWKSSEDAESCALGFSEHKGIPENAAENQTGPGEGCSGKDHDECPDLVDLSTLNKELRPYR